MTGLFFLNKDEQSCKDDVTFRGQFDEKCSDWDKKDCSSDAWTLDLLDKRDLIERCPKSCRQCGGGEVIPKPVTFVIEKIIQ